jgi:magnesium transporter
VEVLTTVDGEQIAELRRADRFFWLDLDEPSHEDIDLLGRLLGLHDLALEDTREMQQPPKVDRFGDHVLVVWWSARQCDADADRAFETVEVHVYVHGSYVMTVRRRPLPALDRLHGELATAGGSESDAVYRILDALTDALGPIVDRIEERVDALEEQVLTRPTRDQIAAIYRLKQDVREVLRRVSGQREAFPAITSAIEALPGLTMGGPQTVSDLRDHLVQADVDLTRSNEDLVSLTSTYFNAATERLNVIATRLSVIATLFLVWTLVTSFFGQNFRWMTDHISSRTDFLVFGVGGMVVSTLLVGAFFWWRRKDLL